MELTEGVTEKVNKMKFSTTKKKKKQFNKKTDFTIFVRFDQKFRKLRALNILPNDIFSKDIFGNWYICSDRMKVNSSFVLTLH
jgi:hypothetical protein